MPDVARTYRRWPDSELRSFHVRLGESDLLISAERPLPELAERALRAARADLQDYFARDPQFARALRPRDPLPGAPTIVVEMAEAAGPCGVGPMAAVAGAVAEYVGRALLAKTPQVIVENGGDIFLNTTRPRVAAIFAGPSPLTGRLGIRLSRLRQPLGLCTSSGTVGPSLSFGRADAAIVLAPSAALADAAATTLGNQVRTEDDTSPALEAISRIPGLLGAAVIVGERFGAWGEIELVNTPERVPADGE
jgi:hypothetical protein